jgi:hypothetical protein
MTKGSNTNPMRPRQFAATRAELRRGGYRSGRWRKARTRAAIAVAAAAALLVVAAPAGATTIRTGHTTVMGHRVAYCTWNPRRSHVHPLVRWSLRERHTVKAWMNRTPRSVCGVNGNTYSAATAMPVGPVRTRGRWVTRKNRAIPVFGFVGRRVVFGWTQIHQRHPANVMSGKAYLVLHGRAIVRHQQAPWATRAQFNCGARGTDGWYGCYRSAVVRFKNGRVGFVSIELASMPMAGAILHRMGVQIAVTGDSGGGEEYAVRRAGELRTFQTIPNAGRYARWRRPIPDAVILTRARRHA